jgi:hypothetical protein
MATILVGSVRDGDDLLILKLKTLMVVVICSRNTTGGGDHYILYISSPHFNGIDGIIRRIYKDTGISQPFAVRLYYGEGSKLRCACHGQGKFQGRHFDARIIES